MHRNKSVTPRVIEANRRNAQKSTGPTTEEGKLAVRHNAVRHGLLAKQILFRHRERERLEFKHLLNSLERDYMPVGVVEQMLVEEIGASWWKLRTATRWELKGLRGHRDASKQVVEQLNQAADDVKLLDSGWDRHTTPQWECESLVIRSSKTDSGASVQEKPGIQLIATGKSSVSKHDTALTEFEATLRSSLPTILRYETTLKRDLYKAIHTLEELQRLRKEGDRKKQRKKRRHHS